MGLMHREMGQPSLVESLLPEKLGQNRRLERIHQAVDWYRIGKLAAHVKGAPEGRPSYTPLLMVKVLLPEQWYNLSDPQMEEALGDRISFHRFVGPGLQEDAPDRSTISRYRKALVERGLAEELFEELGLMLKEGTLMDATLVAAQVRKPPASAGRVAQSTKDPDADWTHTHRGARSHFGYKVHAGWTPGRRWCAGRRSPRPRSTRARRPMPCRRHGRGSCRIGFGRAVQPDPAVHAGGHHYRHGLPDRRLGVPASGSGAYLSAIRW